MTSMGRMPRIWVWVVAVAVACAAVAACGRLGSSSDYFSRGVDRLRAGKYKGAIADFDQVINIRPKYTNAYINRADAKIGLGQYEEAGRRLRTGHPPACSPTTPASTSVGAMQSLGLVKTGRRSPIMNGPCVWSPTTLASTSTGALPNPALVNSGMRSPTMIRPCVWSPTTPTSTSTGALSNPTLVNTGRRSPTMNRPCDWSPTE